MASRKKFYPRERHEESGISLAPEDGDRPGDAEYGRSASAVGFVYMSWTEVLLEDNRSVFVPDSPGSLDGAIAPSSNREELIDLYSGVLLHGQPGDIKSQVDLKALATVWPDVRLPEPVREAWQPLVETELDAS